MRILLLLSLIIGLAGCATESTRPTEDWTERQLYDAARKQLENKNYLQATETLQLLESRYPFGPYADQAQLELIFAYYRSFENEAAIASAERFIRLHPQHPHVDYAYYMMGLAKFTEGAGIFDRFLPVDNSQRDPGPARESFNDFAQLLARFPESQYAGDAKARMVHLRNLLARYEINAANYYFKRGAYLAATNRGRYVVENFPQTPAVADGLAVMVQGYLLLGTPDLADQALNVLRLNYPEHPSLADNGEFITKFTAEGAERSWLNKASFGLLDRAEPPRFEYRTEHGY